MKSKVQNAELDLEKLLREEAVLKRDVAWFATNKNQRWSLHNFAAATIELNGETWNSSESLYQACKYGTDIQCIPKEKVGVEGYEPNVRKRIFQQNGGRPAKWTQKCAQKAGFVREDWLREGVLMCVHAMNWAIEMKFYCSFEQKSQFAKDVLNSSWEHLPFFEFSSKDAYWGAIQRPDGVWRGKNIVGKLIDGVRARADDIIAKRFSYPEGLLLP
jgi:predicted NAD-dependent protein-ADP-ribosyltransferase YbiA (DUF1768 family)